MIVKQSHSSDIKIIWIRSLGNISVVVEVNDCVFLGVGETYNFFFARISNLCIIPRGGIEQSRVNIFLIKFFFSSIRTGEKTLNKSSGPFGVIQLHTCFLPSTLHYVLLNSFIKKREGKKGTCWNIKFELDRKFAFDVYIPWRRFMLIYV